MFKYKCFAVNTHCVYQCISNSIAFYLKTYYLTEIKKECKLKSTVSKNLITFPTSSPEGYTVSKKVLMPVLETDSVS